jgi:hypothetical protein
VGDGRLNARDGHTLSSTHSECFGYGGLTTVLALKNASHGHKNDAHIKQQRGVADVPLVKRVFLLRCQQFSAVDLKAAGGSSGLIFAASWYKLSNCRRLASFLTKGLSNDSAQKSAHFH